MPTTYDQTRDWLGARCKLMGWPLIQSQISSKLAAGVVRIEQANEEEYQCPMRSKCCSICQREIGSAQALGRHMNMHRQFRARLEVSSSSNYVPLQQDQNYNAGKQRPSQFRTFRYKPILHPILIPGVVSSIRFSKVSVVSCTDESDCSSFVIKERIEKSEESLLSSTITSFKWNVGMENFKVMDWEDDETTDNKRRRVDSDSIQLKSCTSGKLDLELRLGIPPTLK